MVEGGGAFEKEEPLAERLAELQLAKMTGLLVIKFPDGLGAVPVQRLARLEQAALLADLVLREANDPFALVGQRGASLPVDRAHAAHDQRRRRRRPTSCS